MTAKSKTKKRNEHAWSRDCPVCFAKAGHPCTAPTNNGRRNVQWVHHKREN